MEREIPSDFRHPPLEVSVSSLVDHFDARRVDPGRTLRNFHHEPPLDPAARESARPSAVLIPLVDRPGGLGLLLTRRTHRISLPGQICFPGGLVERDDADWTQTALRETREETGLSPDAVVVLGSLGHYYSHSGHHIVPVVGLVRPPLDLDPNPGEVEEVMELPAAVAFRSESYRLARRAPESPHAVFHLEHAGARVTGVTVCLLMNLYVDLLTSHAPR